MIDFLAADRPDNYMLAVLLLCQAGPLDIPDVEYVHDLKIEKFEADVNDIRIVANGREFRLKASKLEENPNEQAQ